MIDVVRVPSAALGEVEVGVRVPDGSGPFPALLLLHGRGDDRTHWDDHLATFPGHVAVIPDAPWLDRGGFWLDSLVDGGAAIETALLDDVMPWVAAHYPVSKSRWWVGGYSMGATGAVRLLLHHSDAFEVGIALSPAIYTPTPPADSSTRFGAYGIGDELFVESRYRELTAVSNPAHPVRLMMGVGNDEEPITSAARAVRDRVDGLPNVDLTYAEVAGGHDWGTWDALLDVLLEGAGA